MRPSLEAVLAEVNRIRADFGAPPLDQLPRGDMSGHTCPLAQALPDCEYAGITAWERPCDARMPYPPILRQFVLHFDAKHYPALLLESET